MLGLFKTYAETTSAHGIARVVSARNLTLRVLWGIICTMALAALLYNFSTLMVKYYKHPSTVVIEVSQQPLPFPAITICNMRPLDLYTVADILYDDRVNWRWAIGNFSYSGRPNATQFEQNVIRYVNMYIAYDWLFGHPDSQNSYSVMGSADVYELGTKRSNLFMRLTQIANLHTGTNEGGTLAKQFVMKCEYAGQECSWHNFTHFSDPAYFNCYTFDPSMLNVENTTMSGGPGMGLNLMLFIPTITSLNLSGQAMWDMAMTPDLSYGGEGARIVVHQQGMRPFPNYEGIEVPRGMSVSMGVTVQELRRLRYPHGNCSHIPSYTVPHGYTHSYSLCLTMCAQSAIVRECQCLDFSLPYSIKENNTFCQSFDTLSAVCQTKKSLQQHFNQCRDELSAWFTRRTCMARVGSKISHEQLQACSCVPTCNEYTYTSSMGISSWPVYEQAKTIWEDLTSNPEFSDRFGPEKMRRYFGDYHPDDNAWDKAQTQMAKGNFLRVSIYISDTTTTRVSHVATMTPVTLFSNIGGQLGLWLGASLLTLVEVGELLARILSHLCTRLRNSDLNMRPSDNQIGTSNSPQCSTDSDGNNYPL